MCAISFHFLFFATDLAMLMFDIAYLITIAFQVWLLCYFGQKLIDSSAAVAEGIYESDWMDIDDDEVKKYVVVIMLRAQRPKKLSAMCYADISLETFTTVRLLKY